VIDDIVFALLLVLCWFASGPITHWLERLLDQIHNRKTKI
jgi:hypothetical protein